MATNKANSLGKKAGLILGCAFAFFSAMFITSLLVSKEPPLTTDVFDFQRVLGLEKGIGPKVGDRIDLKQLIGRDRKRLADTVDSKFIAIAIVKSECGMCRIAADTMRYIRDEVEKAGIKYFIVILNPSSPSSGFEYIDSIGVDVPAYLWTGGPESIPEVIPYHYLIDQTGIIIKRWPGSNEDQNMRYRMAKQIVIDTLKIAALKE